MRIACWLGLGRLDSDMIRVFARKTNASPDDDEAFFGPPDMFMSGNGELVGVSCTFTYDKGRADMLMEQWAKAGYDVSCGGPAYGDRSGAFVPGLHVKMGMTITSRGCNNNCWFCYVPKREGKLRELPIRDGWNILDDNLLQCSRGHIETVFAMLKRQKHKARFTGGLEAASLEDWHISLLVDLKPERVYFAYDTSDDFEPLVIAAHKLRSIGWKYQRMSCYVLVGHPKDTMGQAERRLESVAQLGVMPFAMLWRNEVGKVQKEWQRFQRHWASPVAVGSKMKALML